jgi:hypothetical protein
MPRLNAIDTPAQPQTAAAPQPVPPLLNNPHAPEIFTTGCCGLSIGAGTVTITFESAHCDHSDPNCPMERVVVNRTIMPIQAAQALVLQLNDALQRSGHSPSKAATAGMVAQ